MTLTAWLDEVEAREAPRWPVSDEYKKRMRTADLPRLIRLLRAAVAENELLRQALWEVHNDHSLAQFIDTQTVFDAALRDEGLES